jgi:catechol-2,3-dioxygenase
MAHARLVGINHVALEVGDVDAALAFYGRLFEFELRGRGPRMAFIDMGDQFVAISEGRTQAPDAQRHFGLVVDDKTAVRKALKEAGIELRPGRGLCFQDPWGNLVQIVDYREIQFSKAAPVLRGMGLERLRKTDSARRELSDKGLAAESSDH